MIQGAVAADSVRAALDEVFSRAPYQWRDESAATLLVRRWWRALQEWLRQLAGENPELFRLLIWGLVIILAAIAIHSIWLLVRATRRPTGAETTIDAAGTAPVRDADWYRREADRLFREGQYVAALQARFLWFALELDRRDAVRFHPSKTPLEYVAEVPEPDRRGELARLIRDLYRYAFAGDPLGPEEYRAWCAQADPDRYVPAR